MQDLLTVALIWLLSCVALIGGFILYRRRGQGAAPSTNKGQASAEHEAAIPTHRLDRIKRGDNFRAKDAEE